MPLACLARWVSYASAVVASAAGGPEALYPASMRRKGLRIIVGSFTVDGLAAHAWVPPSLF